MFIVEKNINHRELQIIIVLMSGLQVVLLLNIVE